MNVTWEQLAVIVSIISMVISLMNQSGRKR